MVEEDGEKGANFGGRAGLMQLAKRCLRRSQRKSSCSSRDSTFWPRGGVVNARELERCADGMGGSDVLRALR